MQLRECEEKCIDTSGCQAIVWHDTKDPHTENCYLRKNVKIAECNKNQAFNLRILNPEYVRPQTTSSSTTPTTTLAKTTLPPVHASGRWPTIAGKFCQNGAGGVSIAAPGYNPYHIHQLLVHCQALCNQQADCNAIVMRDVQSGQQANCWLFTQIDWANCQADESAAVWYKPGAQYPANVEWMSYAAKNCYEGRGGSYAVPNQDVVPGHQTLKECQGVCNSIVDCEAFVWHDTKDSVTSNCYLRKNIAVGDCETTQAFNLRIKKSYALKKLLKKFAPPEDGLSPDGAAATWNLTFVGSFAAGLLSAAAGATLARRWARPSTHHIVLPEANDMSDPAHLLAEAE
mmetsp:Transcript_53436/g.105405  ORF Transcript_53436/g.105405 Transcript_53436/m.105405 type:complete len:343 (+) Transcript_53436:171-1199(+)